MKKFLLMLFMAVMAVPAVLANEVYFYFQDGEEDDFELMAPQTLVTVWNETDEEMVPVPEDMAFMAYQFEGAKILRISANDYDYEVVVDVDGGDNYFLEKEDNEWYLTLLPEANDLEIYVKVYLAGMAPGQDGPASVTMNFNILAAEGSDIQNPGEQVKISYFDTNLFQNVDLTIDDNYAGASVNVGTSFEISPAEGYVITDVMTYLPGIASVSSPGEDENIWRLSVSWEPEGDFASYFITVDRIPSDPDPEPNDAKITQIESRQWKVEWPAYTFISRTDSDYNNTNVFITDAAGKSTVLYSDLHGEHDNPAIIFPSEWGNYFTVNLNNIDVPEGSYSLTIPEGYVELGSDRLRSPAQYFEIEVGKKVENSYNVQFSEVEGNTFDISWENVTSLEPGTTEGAYMRNVMTNEEYVLYFLEDYMYSKCNLRIYNGNMLRVNLTNNYPDLPSGMYELYIPADYVKFNGTDTGNEAIEGHMFVYTAPWTEGRIEFNALLEENKLTVEWLDASEIAYNTEYAGDGHGIKGITIFDPTDYYLSLDYEKEFTVSGNKLTIDLTGLPLTNGECTLLIPEDCLFVTVGGITDYTYGTSFRFQYGNNDNPDVPQLYPGEATWSRKTGDTVYSNEVIEVSWNNYELTMFENPEAFSVHSPATGVLNLEYGTDVTLSADKTKILISLGNLPEGTYRVNVPEACVYLNVNGTIYLNSATSMDGIKVSSESGIDSVSVDKAGRYVVVNLNGVTVMDTDNAADLNNLPHGFYIVNGKKLVK